MMIRTQVQLTEEQLRRLRQLARQEDVSVAELVRRSVDCLLDSASPDRAELYERAAEYVGRFRDSEGAADVATDHDRYLEDAYR